MALVTKTANCGTMADWFKAQSRYYAYTTTPKVGDIVFYDWNGKHTSRAHVGIVTAVNSDGSIQAIEGNTSVSSDDNGGNVMRRTRSKTYITGYGRPAYASDAERTAYITLAEQQLGTKENPSGSNKVKYNTWFYGSEVSGSAYPWCAAFISWLFNSGAVEDVSKAASVSASAEDTEAYGEALTVELHELSKGCKGAEVRTIQRIIYARGINKSLAVDGDFGTKTYNGVVALQKQLFPNDKTQWDGVVGSKTWTGALKELS